jgi:hypothetical protein
VTSQTIVSQIATDDLLEKAIVDMLVVLSFDEVFAGTRTRALRKDKARRIARQAAREILAALNENGVPR